MWQCREKFNTVSVGNVHLIKHIGYSLIGRQIYRRRYRYRFIGYRDHFLTAIQETI